jgi:hypothetical protein
MTHRFPDIISPGFHPWRELKYWVFGTQPKTAEDLKSNISTELAAIPMQCRVVSSCASRLVETKSNFFCKPNYPNIY